MANYRVTMMDSFYGYTHPNCFVVLKRHGTKSCGNIVPLMEITSYMVFWIVPCWEYVLKYSYHTPFNKDSIYCWVDSIHNA